MISRETCIRIGGVVHVPMVVFHAAFPWLFRWRQTLSVLGAQDRALTYALSNHCTLVLAAFCYWSLAHAHDFVHTNLGRGVAKGIAAFYLLRIVEEWTLFEEPPIAAAGLSLVCAVFVVLYGLGAFAPTSSTLRARPIGAAFR